MKEHIMPAGGGEIVRRLADINEATARWGLKLSESDAKALELSRERALIRAGRAEFSGGAVKSIILAFCDSKYISQDGWRESLEEFIEAFYEFKTDTMDLIDDAEAVELMRRMFEGQCGGSIDALREDLADAARRIRNGEDIEDGDEYWDDSDEGDGYDE